MQSESSHLPSRLSLLRLSLRSTYERESAYVANNWGSLLSTFMYTASFLAFVTIIYGNVRQIAGYSRDEMLFFTMICQLNFYLIFTWQFDNLEQLVADVNRGDLDLLLSKPLPSLYYVCIRQVSILQVLRDALPPLALMAIAIHWQNLHFTAAHLLSGIAVFILGLFCQHVVHFLLMIPVFWLGEANGLFSLVYALGDQNIPYEGYPAIPRIAFTYFVPVLLSTALAASVMLGKQPVGYALLIAAGVTAAGMFLRAAAWRLALRNYTSASS